MSITPEELVSALTGAYKTYTDGLTDKLETGIKKIADETKAEVKANSPVKSGKYKKSWKVTITAKRGGYRATVHNKEYSLVHLLELGHLNRDGTTRSQKFPHVEPAEKSADKKLDKLIKEL